MSERMTKKEVLARIKGLDDDTAKSVVCALVGHSRIRTTFFGYYYCARCGEQVGDSLGSIYFSTTDVIVGHNCPTCRENAKSLTWRDKLLSPDPFKAEEAGEVAP